MELAKNLKGHILLLHGLQDYRVHPASVFRLIQAFIEAGKPFDMCVFPDETHQFSRGKYLPYILKLMQQYFAQNLMGDPRSKAEVFEKYDGPALNSSWMPWMR